MDSSVIIAIIAEQLGIDEKTINENTSFADLGADSLDLFQIISALEEEFDIEFEGDDAEDIKTVGEAIDYIRDIVEQ
ncbi:MAG: acyl carrier protein [Firmicutes bacterium]|nr:acyl carrier protein [Bacillota bacterium]